jgi:predicted amidophosphoribosyltransferase
MEEVRDEKGFVKAWITDIEHYPGLKVLAISSGFYYEKCHNESRSLKIIESKEKDLSSYFFIDMKNVFDEYNTEFGLGNFDLISVVPTSKHYLPFSPTMVGVANKLSQYTNIPFSSTIRKIRFDKTVKRTREDRFNAVKGTMEANKNVVSGKKILLLDDVRTSGITSLECKKILIEAGAQDVVCLSLGTHTSVIPY